MTITKSNEFREWAGTASIEGRVQAQFYYALLAVGDKADPLIDQAHKQNWSSDQMLEALRSLSPAGFERLEKMHMESKKSGSKPKLVIVPPAPAASPEVIGEKKKKWQIWKKEEPKPAPAAVVAPSPKPVMPMAAPSMTTPFPYGANPSVTGMENDLAYEEPKGDESAPTSIMLGGLGGFGKKSGSVTAKPSTPSIGKMSSGKRSMISSGGLSGAGDAVKSHFGGSWQGYVFIIAFALLIGTFFMLASNVGIESAATAVPHDDSGTGNSLVQFVIPLSLPIILSILIVAVLEAATRFDPWDAIVVFISITSMTIGKMYLTQFNSITTELIPGVSLGAVISVLLIFGPFLVLTFATKSNRADNLFIHERLAGYDFSALYNTLLLMWALAMLHQVWPIVPDPCVFNPNIYLGMGLLFLSLELSGHWFLPISLFVGVASGFLMGTKMWPWTLALYLILVIASFSMKEETSINAGGAKRSADDAKSVFSRPGSRLVVLLPYDLYSGVLWFTLIALTYFWSNPVVTISEIISKIAF